MPLSAEHRRTHYGPAWRRETRPAMLRRCSLPAAAYLALLPAYPRYARRRGELLGSAAELQVCECTGECSQPHGWGRCPEVNGTLALTFRGDVRLAVAHLNQRPGDDAPENLRVLCQACHNRLDGPYRTPNAWRTRRAREARAQLPLWPDS